MRKIEVYTKVDIKYQSERGELENKFLKELGKEFSVSDSSTALRSVLTKKCLETKTPSGELAYDAIKRNNQRIKKIAKAAGVEVYLDESYYFVRTKS